MADLYPKQYLYRRVVRAKLYIDEHYASPIDLDKIADEACFSKFHFLRLFRQVYGRTPHQYLIDVRVEKAKERLAHGASVKEASYGVGFDSLTSFAGLFRRRVGITPAAFRQDRESRLRDIERAPLGHIPGCFAEKKGWKE